MSGHSTLAHHAQTDRIRAFAEAPAILAEDAFDRLNPDFGIPADTRDLDGHQAVQDRETGLALGSRAAVAITRENQSNPVVRFAGQDDRVAAAVRLARTRQGPGRNQPER
jgi:hypothetical protein